MKFSTFFIALFVPLFLMATAPVDTLNFDADPYFILTEEADSAIAHRNWPEAAARLSDAMAVRPDAPTNLLLRTNLAGVYSCMGHDSLALVQYDMVLDRAPGMFTTLMGRGRLLVKMGRDVEAYDDFSRAIEIDSLNTEVRFYHGMMALYGGNRNVADRDFSVLARVAPKARDTAVALGTLYALTGRERQAVPYLQSLVDDDPQPEYFAYLAGCYLGLGQLSDAGAVINRGLKVYPEDPELYYYRAWLNRDRYHLDDARSDGRRAIQLGASPVRVAELFAGLEKPQE